ncbi:hypothetical protein TRFO_06101 [Tritrichomonas foetus]|uniref:Uncharacterized protein n=1 Tax=Tritrichomonas foetus TaxID=1144522 RepID=A0A1J4K1H6_9EUKA|nr:hypothetical protein [Tritrichomonas foetus]OHT05091.1 hypothetical protein TRFO_06101 [Tritrichomonas foetus]|eukprot:OHT05091.1 hypothetical protein TRFO_06101 [Tritrichomonas foetus]
MDVKWFNTYFTSHYLINLSSLSFLNEQLRAKRLLIIFLHFSSSKKKTQMSHSRLGSGYSRSRPVDPAYQPALLSGTTEQILELRRKIHGCDSCAAAKTRGRYHWSNIPSGNDIAREFNRKYPACQITPRNSNGSSFPYPNKSQIGSSFVSNSHMCASCIASQSFAANQPQPQRRFVQPQAAPSRRINYDESGSDDEDYDNYGSDEYESESGSDDEEEYESGSESGSEDEESADDERIRRALQHIDHASRILENY